MSIPSLRQKQINEVLDYHKLMNQVVFNRNIKSVAAQNEKATPPHRTDLEIEAEFRSKVDAIKQSLSELVNMYGYLGLGSTSISGGVRVHGKIPGAPERPVAPGTSRHGTSFEYTLPPAPVPALSSESSIPASAPLPGPSGPPAPGTVAANSVAASSSKAQTKIDSIISTILSNYNSLVQYYENKNRQKIFSENEIQSLIGIVKELDSPIVNAIGQLMVFKGQPFYLKSYNILKNILNAVRAAPPLQKIPFELLNKEYFVPEERGTVPRHIDSTLIEHLATASADIESNIDRYTKLVPSNRTEEKGRQLVLDKLYQTQGQITKLIESHRSSGKPLSDAIARKYDADLAKIKGLSNKYLPGVPLSLRTITVDFGPSTGAPVRSLPEVLETGPTRTVGPRGEPPTMIEDGKVYKLDPETGEYFYIGPEESKEPGEEKESKSDSESEESESGYLTSEDQERELNNLTRIRANLTKEYKEVKLDYDNPFTTPSQKEKLVKIKNQIEQEIKDVDKRGKELKSKKPTHTTGPRHSLEEFVGPHKPHKPSEQPVPPERTVSKSTKQKLEDKLAKHTSDLKRLNDTIEDFRSKGTLTKEENELYKKYLYFIPKVTKDIEDTQRQLRGRGKPRKGKLTSCGGNRFGDETILEPYLTKHLRPSKFHSKIPAEQRRQESSSSESDSDLEPDHVTSSSESESESGSSSSSSEEGAGRRGAGAKARRTMKHKNIVNPNLILKQGKAGLSLIDKVMAKPRGGGGKKKAVKPLVNNNRDKDYWFMG